MIYKQALSEKQRLQKNVQSFKNQLASLPEGSFYCVHDAKRLKWFYKLDGKKHYISKKKRDLAVQLAIRRYISTQLKDCEQELAAINAYLELHNPLIGLSAEELLSQPEYQELILPYFQPLSQKHAKWANEPYQSNPEHPEHLKYQSPSGRMLRSKSEVFIEMLLLKNHIPFRYEAPLVINGITYYPDFTILHPVTGQIFYWEHAGMMEKPRYRTKTFRKLEQYASANIYPGINLIITFETDTLSFDPAQAQEIINQFFL